MIDILKIGFITLTLVDLIDISIVAILFFFLYKALKGTVAVQILIGLVVLIFLSFLTEAITLKSVNWIIKTIQSVWLVAFIVLFQPEIRRLLMMITRTQFFRMFIKSKTNETLDIIVDTSIEMAEKHIGGLICFTRSQNIGMTIDTGVEMQSMISKEILISIFNTKSPLHDGAVIIDGDKILAAKCILPLSSNTKYEGKILGTRHRAALGLSDQVDALILIISEETGFISIAEEGRMMYNIQKKELKNILIEKLLIKN